MKIPFLQLSDSNRPYAKELKEAAARVIDSGWYLNGSENKQLEEEICKVCKIGNCVTVSNGLDALRLIFKAYLLCGKLQKGDEVIVQANTYIASILSISDNGLIPILAEPEERTFNLDALKIENLITPKTKAVLVVHLYGSPCWNKEIKDIAQRYNLLVIEDNAQAIGAKALTTGIHSESTVTGSLGDAAAFSFYPTKNIGALGDAGAVTSDDAELISSVRTIANYGSDRRYHNIYQGYNCRMDELQAAFLRVKLQHLDEEISHRQAIARFYNDNITNPLISTPAIIDGMSQVWHQYVLRCSHRDKLKQYLADCGIGTDIHYATPPHKQPCYKGILTGEYPITEHLADEILSLPIATIDLSTAEIIADTINNFSID